MRKVQKDKNSASCGADNDACGKNKRTKAVRRTSIGGQAVLEGVMMKGAHSIATAVRSQTGEITVESKYVKSSKERNAFLRLPFVRGIVNLFSQLFQGTGILLRSAEVYGDFAEPSKFEKWFADKFKINPMNVLMGFSVLLGVLIAVALFVFLPNFLTGLIFKIPELSAVPAALQSLVEGLFMILIFVAYILIVTLMKDIRRLFMYHGAEHKVISCYEHGLELNVENARTMSREHSRCGTTFMFLVIAVSILVFALVNWLLSGDVLNWLTGNSIVDAFIKLGVKLLFLPVVAGTSYEILKLLAKSDCLLFRILRAPGMLLQKLTTKEPTDEMLEVSLTAFKTVMAMDADNTVPERQFDISIPYGVARARLEETLKTAADASDVDWLMVEVTGKKRSELKSIGTLSKEQYDSAMKIAEKMKDGMPLQYALGNTEFYGIRLAVNSNVLIPRQETEELVEKAIKRVNALNGGAKILDLATGSGAIAIALAKNTTGTVTASDVSEAAVTVARANALNAGADVNFLVGDLFAPLGVGEKFDVIVTNPPYIASSVIETLDAKVKNFEPRGALDGGADGLNFYRRIAETLDTRLNEGGAMLAEIGFDQADAVKDVFSKFDVKIEKDVEGNDRIALVERKAE